MQRGRAGPSGQAAAEEELACRDLIQSLAMAEAETMPQRSLWWMPSSFVRPSRISSGVVGGCV